MKGVSEVQSLDVDELVPSSRLLFSHQSDVQEDSQESREDREKSLMNSKEKRGVKLNVRHGIRKG